MTIVLSLAGYALLLVVVLLHPQGTENTNSCAPIVRHPTEHSTYTPDFDQGAVTFTLWQAFCVTGDDVDVFISNWTVDPHPPRAKNDSGSLRDCDYPVTKCSACANASIEFFDATSYDWGNYIVTVQSRDCGSFSTSTFEVHFGHCNGSAPEPTTPNGTVESHQHDKCEKLSIQFKGDLDLDHYDIQWTNATDNLLCADDDDSYSTSKYTCNRIYPILDQCTFVSHLWICDFEQNDLGVYCAQSHSVSGGLDGRNQSCMTLSAPASSSVSVWVVVGGVMLGVVVGVGMVLLSLLVGVTYLCKKKKKQTDGQTSNIPEGTRRVSPTAEGNHDNEQTPLLSEQDWHPEAEVPCIPSVPTPKKKFQEADLSSFCPHTIPRVPAIVIHCVNEIEKRGLTEVGIYRVPGSDKVVKEVKERLLKAKGNPGLDKVANIHVLCSVLKDFIRSLREPILTFRMHKAFTQAAEAESDEEGLALTLEAIAELPPANKDTLAFLILHLLKVASYSDANKMPVANLAAVFGPTIVGYSCTNPEPAVMWQDTQIQPKVMQRLLGISGDYWRQYLSPVDNPDPQSPAPSSP